MIGALHSGGVLFHRSKLVPLLAGSGCISGTGIFVRHVSGGPLAGGRLTSLAAGAKGRAVMSDQTQRRGTRPSDMLEPVQANKPAKTKGTWTDYLVLFLPI